jgi:hypothetical protein
VDGSHFMLVSAGGNGAVRDVSGCALAFSDAYTCAAVGAFLAAAGSEPLIAPVPAPDDLPGARFVESDETALNVLHDLLDALARRREEIAEAATQC